MKTPKFWGSALWNPYWLSRAQSHLGCGEQFSILEPDLVLNEQRALLSAGLDAISTNTFAATASVMSDYVQNPDHQEVNRRSAALAKQASVEFSDAQRTRVVLGSIGPTSKFLSLHDPDVKDIHDLRRDYITQIEGLLDGEVDFLHIERCHSCQNAKVALEAVSFLQEKRSIKIPAVVSAHVESTGTMLDGSSPNFFWRIVKEFSPTIFGISGSGTQLEPLMKELSEEVNTTLAVFLDTYVLGLEEGWIETPESFVAQAVPMLHPKGAAILGFGFGTTPEFVREAVLLLTERYA